MGRDGFCSFATGRLCQLRKSPWRGFKRPQNSLLSDVKSLLEIEAGYTR